MIVGVNKYQLAKEDPIEILEVDNDKVREQQIARLEKIRATRDAAKVQAALEALTAAAQSGDGNLLELSIQAIRLRATVGEVSRCAGEGLRAPPRRYAKGDRRVCSCLRLGRGLGQAEGARSTQFAEEQGRRPRVMIAKLGQDGHDRGAKVVATAFADLGFDVDIGPAVPDARGMRAPGDRERRARRRRVARWPPATRRWCRRSSQALKKQGADDIIVFVGGVIPQQDYDFLYEAGVKGIYGPGTPIPASAKDVLEQIRKAR